MRTEKLSYKISDPCDVIRFMGRAAGEVAEVFDIPEIKKRVFGIK